MDYLPSFALPLRTGRPAANPEQQLLRQLFDENDGENDGENGHRPLPRREHDILFSFSAVLGRLRSFDGTLALLQVPLPSEKYAPAAQGSYFQIVTTGSLRKPSRLCLAQMELGKDNTAWSAMTREFRILKDDHLAQYANIVRLLGVCWQTSSTSVPISALVIEAAEMDLDKYFVGGRVIKPKNIPLFHKGEEQWIAKIADFGGLLIGCKMRGSEHLQFVSRFWAAPETLRPPKAEVMQQANLFSLSIVLWKILRLNALIPDLEKLAGSKDEDVISAVLKQLKTSGHLAGVAHASVWRPHDGRFRLPRLFRVCPYG
ncbi:MAG: hypothetical protein M1829_002438 [Trizodia sp. TS-e1964]|nr:MAG: hypothetical protein M1829_002438 [Trizodia sp. TS-e1964]